MKNALIGYTGFVGGNLLQQYKFDYLYNSKNINDAKGKHYNKLFISGVPAVKWWANQHPIDDWKNINSLIEILKTVTAEEVILISTVDVYPNPIDFDEDGKLSRDVGQPYGLHRLKFEDFINNNFKNVYTLRLPGLFGQGLKKNIIYDFLNNNQIEKIDTRSSFQFYCLNCLKSDISRMIENDIRLLNAAVEPVPTFDIAKMALGYTYENITNTLPPRYDIKSKYSSLWGGQNGYLYSKQNCLIELEKFIGDHKRED
ncbi:NAD(P)-dependent oxidoreductase [Photorhabdus bodei]|uniref:NAD(P)-dependent oxidoreductase n=1 Tax=Photorhabdus bodei TaxID=2029681 RepID=A0AAW6BNG3_9GAMM|nr:NAD(P)-dependent oxidoreductase [Photorhabdus bodei]MDB6374972.1 NAD(P)-dependent oxidoreductase [Photorhabdus bodei]